MARTYLRQFAEQVRALGADVELWLSCSGLTSSVLDDDQRDLPPGTFEKLVINAISLTREPAIGLLVGRRLQIHAHGALGYAALNSRSLRQALTLVETFLRARFSFVELGVTELRHEVRIEVKESRALGAARQPVFEAVLMATKNILEAISSGSCHIESASFPFESPPYAKLAATLFGFRVRYGRAWAGLTLPRNAVDVPLRAADAVAFREALRICERELELVPTATLSGRVRRLLLQRENGFPSLDVVAGLLHLTPRTLHRRLVEEGTSFRDVLEDVRHRLALEYLKGGRTSLKDVASLLGYRDFANFRRAFKRWEGVAPTKYRPDGSEARARAPSKRANAAR